MLITMENGKTVDYGIFAVCLPELEVTAVASSVIDTPLSGDVPATMVIRLKTGELLCTKQFVAYGDGDTFCEFAITDRELLDQITSSLPGITAKEYLGVDVIGDSSGWVLGITFVPGQGYDVSKGEDYVFLEIANICWTIDKIGG